MKFITVMLALGAFCFAPVPNVRAESGAQFFVALPDLPLMSGLVELIDQTVSFDKAEGRIIESVAQIERLSEGEIQNYYESVMPQFGWLKVSENAFVRGAEHLQMSFEDYEGQQFLRIMIAPR